MPRLKPGSFMNCPKHGIPIEIDSVCEMCLKESTTIEDVLDEATKKELDDARDETIKEKEDHDSDKR